MIFNWAAKHAVLDPGLRGFPDVRDLRSRRDVAMDWRHRLRRLNLFTLLLGRVISTSARVKSQSLCGDVVVGISRDMNNFKNYSQSSGCTRVLSGSMDS